MDLETDQEFLWLAKESLNAELPAGLISRTFGKDQHYYVNRITGDTIWEHPADKIYKERFLDLKKKSEEENDSAYIWRVIQTSCLAWSLDF